jgi:hypothetical protein
VLLPVGGRETATRQVEEKPSRRPPSALEAFHVPPAAVATKTAVAIGNTHTAGKLASTCTIGRANRETLGVSPIHTPIHIQITPATATVSNTRPKVISPRNSACGNSPSPTEPYT